MVRAVNDKYNVWIAGYYDDFTGARAVPQDMNTPNTDNDYLHYLSHFGNPLNGEARLNPRYRWCIMDRVYDNSTLPSTTFFTSSTYKLLHNKGMFEWLGYDPIRNYSYTEQGRSTLEYPDGHTNANKFRTSPTATTGTYGADAFQMFCNGHDSSGYYVVPTGSIDASYARNSMIGFNDNTKFEAKETGLNNISGSTNITTVTRAHLAGRWVGETINYSSGTNDTAPENIFAEVKSPSGQPFLCVQQYGKTGHDSTLYTNPTIFYNGNLNSRDTGDYLSFRICVRSFNGATTNDGKVTPRVHIKAGFPKTNGGITSTTLSSGDSYGANTHYEEGLIGTPAIAFDLDLTGYDTHPMLYSSSTTASTIPTTDEMWIDVDIHLDYDSGTKVYKVYQDGVLKSTNNFATDRVADEMYGWEIYTRSPAGSDNTTTTIMLDRAALYRPLTDDPSGVELNPMQKLSFSMPNNGISMATLEFEDEPVLNEVDYQVGFVNTTYDFQVTEIFNGSLYQEWYMLVFAGAGETGAKDIARIDRPIWKGMISNVSVKESLQRKRILTIEAQDNLALLDKQLPLWESGQGGTNDNQAGSLYWKYEAEGMKELMNMGASSLKTLAGNLGRDSNSSYQNRDNQRTQLHSAHPIQLYNNEDTFGPNNIENEFEGMGIDYIRHNANGTLTFVMTGNPVFIDNSEVTIDHTGISSWDGATLDIESVAVVDGKQEITFLGDATQDLPNNQLLNDINTYSGHNIVYAGKYIGKSISYDDINYKTRNEFAAGLPYHYLRDFLEYYNWATLVEQHPQGFSVGEIIVTNQGENYTTVNRYKNADGDMRGTLTLPNNQNTLTDEWGNNYSRPASAEWVADQDGKIIQVEVLDAGNGYDTFTLDDDDMVTTGNFSHGGAGNHDGIKTFSTNTAITETDILSQVQTCVALNAGGSRVQEDCAEFQVISTFAECTYNSSVNSGKTVIVPATSGGTDDARNRDAPLTVGMLVLGVDVPSNTKIESISDSTTIILDKATTSNSTAGKLTFVGVSKQGANYNSSGSGTDKTTNIIISRVGGASVTLPIIVDSTSTDATFDVKLVGEEETNYYTFHFDSDPNLIFGDEFVISNTGTSGNANRYQAIAGKHKVKKIKKVFNYHSTARNTRTNVMPTGGTDYLWQVQTYTPYSGTEFGSWTSNSGLLSETDNDDSADEKIKWLKVNRGIMKPAPTSEDVSSRVTHAVWMRDMPKSLWFQYHFGQIKSTPLISWDNYTAISANTSSIEITSATYGNASLPNSGVGEIVRPADSAHAQTRLDIRDFFTYKFKYTTGSGGGTRYFLGGVQYISMAHPTVKLGWTGFTSYITSPVKVNILDIDTNYKHMWLLWADMRNDGTADADGSTRKTSFGLLNPRSKNYNVNMLFENQFDENGNPSIFAELKNNDDIDMWEIDSTRDDTTGIPFSYPVDYANQKFATVDDSSGNLVVTTKDASGSAIAHGLSVGDYVYIMNSQDAKHDGKHQIASKTTNTFTITGAFVSADSAENGSFLVVAQCIGSASDLAVYKDWETKGGCLLAIDTSKFFNLNTLANNGHSGKDGGGKTDLSDYYAVSKGDVALIDNYYMYAPSTVLSTDTNYGKHINQEKIISSSCELTGDISKGQFYLTPSDVTMFNDNGAGRIVGYKDEARTELYYAWDGKLDTAITGTLDSMTVTATDGHWVLTDSGAFTNAKVGMYIKNTSKPLVAGVGESWETNHIQTHWYRIKEVTNANSIKVERVVYLPYSLGTPRPKYMGQKTEYFINLAQGLRAVVTLTQRMLDDGWASNSNYEIPAQLGNVIIESATSITTDTTYSVAEIENGFVNIATELNTLRGDAINYSKIDLVNSNYTEVEVFTNLSPQYAYRLMMNIDGEVETPNNGTFYHSDKFRTLWSAGLLDSWWLNTRLSCMFDINNIPITNMMTTYDSVSSNDEYGSIYNAKGKTLFNTIKGIQKQSGQGRINSLETSFSYLMGRDNRIEFRPKYNSGIALDRNNVKVSQMNLNAGTIIENVRVYYNNNNNFVDYPSASLNDTTRWKIISNDDIFSDVEANRLAKETYRKNKQQSLKMSVQPIRAIGDTDIMLDGGRYGYICDAHVALQGHDDNSKASAWCWTRYGTGGVLFPGMVNALDGNLGGTITNSTLYTRQGDSGTPTYSATLPITDNYYWYGSKSVSRAVQIVHVSKDTPKSHASGELRIFVALKADQAAQSDIENLQFTVYIPHYSFATTAGTPNDVAPTRAATLLSVSSQDVKHSGFYELDVPSSYGTGKIVFSFNAEYCRDLVRSRCGSSNTHLNAHDVGTIDLGSSFNTDSIFPLGMRQYDEFKGGLGSQRTEYYAPTINIVDDLTYVPATYVTYTDAGHDLSSQVLVIQNVEWSVSAGNVETVTLELDRDESVQAGGVVPYIMERLPHVQPTHGPTYTLPLPVSVTEEIETLDTLPINGNNPGSGFDNSIDNAQGTKVNDMDRGLYNTIKGKMGMKGSEFSPQSKFAILGQNKPPTTPSNMRGMFGNLRAPVNSGSALENPHSFSLPGKGNRINTTDGVPDKREIRHSVEIEMTTPNDAVTDEINITATLDMKPTNEDSTGVLYVTATCRETGDAIQETVKIKAGTYNNYTLMSTQLLNGVKTAGNNLVITVGREPGSGSDDANYQAIRVKNFHVNFRRAAFNSENAGNSFIPYS
jgi:hypothetical protein